MKGAVAEAFRISIFSLGTDVDLFSFNRRISRIQGKVAFLLKDLALGKRLKFSLCEENDHLWMKISISFSGQRGLFEISDVGDDGRAELARECQSALERLFAKSEILQELCGGGDLTTAALDRILLRRGLDSGSVDGSTLPLGDRGMPLTPMISDASGWIQDFQLGQNPKIHTSARTFPFELMVEMVGTDIALVRVKHGGPLDLLRRRNALPMNWPRVGTDYAISEFLFEQMTFCKRVLVSAHIRRHISGKIVGLYVPHRDALSVDS